jgi:hypothetical protein
MTDPTFCNPAADLKLWYTPAARWTESLRIGNGGVKMGQSTGGGAGGMRGARSRNAGRTAHHASTVNSRPVAGRSVRKI